MSIVSKEKENDDALIISSQGRHTYTNEYKNTVFMSWYSLGKPGGLKLHENIEIDVLTNGKPSIPLLRNWIENDFKERAIFMDSQVAKELEEHMVKDKVEMLDRHAKVGVALQDKAMKYINEHEDEMKIPFALKALVEGVRIERESRGVASALEKMLDKSDDDLLKEVIALVNKSPAEFEQIESGTDEETSE
jgi:hypothetical protein